VVEEAAMGGRLLTIGEVADWLRLPVATLYRWRYERRGPRGFRVGRHLRYLEADVDAWISQQRDRDPAA
jgi:excisionase family DNA binding protein